MKQSYRNLARSSDECHSAYILKSKRKQNEPKFLGKMCAAVMLPSSITHLRQEVIYFILRDPLVVMSVQTAEGSVRLKIMYCAEKLTLSFYL